MNPVMWWFGFFIVYVVGVLLFVNGARKINQEHDDVVE